MKRIVWIALGLGLCLSLLAGCGPKEEADAGANQDVDELEFLLGSLEPDPTPTPLPLTALYYDYSDYRNVLQNTESKYEADMGGQYLEHCLCDLDGAGVYELIVKEGTCEADFVWRVYTIGETGAKDVGSFGGSHSVLYTDSEPGLLCAYGQMGHEEIARVSYDGQYLSVQTLISQDLAEGEEYSHPGERLTTQLIGDPSLIP